MQIRLAVVLYCTTFKVLLRKDLLYIYSSVCYYLQIIGLVGREMYTRPLFLLQKVLIAQKSNRLSEQVFLFPRVLH